MQPQNQEQKLVGGTVNKLGKNIFCQLPIVSQDLDVYYNQDDLTQNDFSSVNQQIGTYKFLLQKEGSNHNVQEQMTGKNHAQSLIQSIARNDEGQHVMLADLEKTGKKIPDDNKELFPAFTLITNEDKGKINAKRYILRSMLNPYNRQKAKAEFVELASFVSQECQRPLISDFEEENSQKQKCFQWYSKQCFYYKVINRGLRAFKSPEEYYYLRLIFSDLFTTILQKYQSEKNDGFLCWRKSFMAQEQISKLKANIGEYIELQGFISTSKNIKQVSNFPGNVLFQIKVPAKEISKNKFEINNGYASIEKQSNYKEQEQVLFNAINYFKVVKIEKVNNQKWTHHIFLEYYQQREDEQSLRKEEQLRKNYAYQHNKAIKIRNQGDCFFQCGEYQKSLQWLNQKQVKIQQQFKKKFKVQITSKFSEEQEKKEFYSKYINIFFVRVSCLNNLKKYEQAYKQIKKCELLYKSMNVENNENYFFILKAKGHIQLNCGKTAQGLNSLKRALQEFQKFLQISEKNSKKQERWKNKKKKDQFRDEIIATLRYWKDCENFALEEEIEKKLKEMQGTRGKKNVFYFTNLKNKFIVLYEKNKWKEIIEEFKNLKKELKNLSTNKNDINFLTYVACLSYLQVNLVNEAQKILKEFIKNLNKENENSIKISCAEAIMFLHLVATFVSKTYNQKYFDYLTDLVKFQFCYADKLEEQTDFQFRKDNLIPFLFEKPKLMKGLEIFTVERTFDQNL